jgi:diacylglycerol kinase (ATP)
VLPVQVIANPNAQGGRGRRILPVLESALRERGRAFRLHATRAPGHGRELARELAGGGHRVPGAPLLVVGGDGTLHEVANGLRDAGFPPDLPLAVLPMGTGNDFHRMLRTRGTLAEVLDLLEEGVPRPLDVGEVRWDGGEAAFVNLLGVGIDVAVLERRGAFQRLPGLLQYGFALLSALRRFQPVPLAVDAEGMDSLLTPVLLAAATVGPSIGGGFQLSPRARGDDGLLDLFVAGPLTFGQVLRYLPGVVRGTLESADQIHRATFASARFEATDGRPFRFELDGELMPHETPWLEMRIRPGVLQVLDHR